MYIELYDMCQAFNCLPRAGGMLDQDPSLMQALRMVGVARFELEERDRVMKEAEAKAKGPRR